MHLKELLKEMLNQVYIMEGNLVFLDSGIGEPKLVLNSCLENLKNCYKLLTQVESSFQESVDSNFMDSLRSNLDHAYNILLKKNI